MLGTPFFSKYGQTQTCQLFYLRSRVYHCFLPPRHPRWTYSRTLEYRRKKRGRCTLAGLTAHHRAVVWAPVGLYVGKEDVIGAWDIWVDQLSASAAYRILYFIVLLRGYRKTDLTVVYPWHVARDRYYHRPSPSYS